MAAEANAALTTLCNLGEKLWAEPALSRWGQVTSSADLHWPLPSTSRLNNWLTLPVRWGPTPAWLRTHSHHTHSQTHTHRHTLTRACKHAFGSMHKRTESSVSGLNVLTASVFPNTEDVSHYHQHQSVLMRFFVNFVYFITLRCL